MPAVFCVHRRLISVVVVVVVVVCGSILRRHGIASRGHYIGRRRCHSDRHSRVACRQRAAPSCLRTHAMLRWYPVLFDLIAWVTVC